MENKNLLLSYKTFASSMFIVVENDDAFGHLLVPEMHQ